MDGELVVSLSENTSKDSNDSKDLIKDGKNSTSIMCLRCPSVILKPHLAVHAQKQVVFPVNLTNKYSGKSKSNLVILLTYPRLMYVFDNRRHHHRTL